VDPGGKQDMKEVRICFIAILALLFSFNACNKNETKPESNSPAGENVSSNVSHKIEFVELGSVNCIPCRQMQPVMASVEKKYKGLVKVTFHDVWKDDAPAKKYGIDLIPTQVFLDGNGNELMRHQGFFAEEEIDKFLLSQGVSIPD
jgi:thioredoxin 1